ncbi:MAG: hypothetical protein AB7I35_01305 [Ramlibacter sp.]
MPLSKPTKPAPAPNVPEPVPSRRDRANFAARGDATLTALPDAVDGVNEAVDYVNDAADYVEEQANTATTQATTATTQAGIAATAAASATGAANVNGTSASSNTPAVGVMGFVYVETGKTPVAGMRMRAASRAALTTNYALGVVSDYNSGTRTVTLAVDLIGAAPATASDWNLILEGQPGTAGDDADVTLPTKALAANSALVAGDNGYFIACSAAITLTPDSAATLGDGWAVPGKASAAGSVTISATFDTGATSRTVPPGRTFMLTCNGSVFRLAVWDNPSSRYKDLGTISSGTTTVDTAAAEVQRVQAGGNFTLAFDKWPASGEYVGELLLKCVNFGAHTVTWPTANWLKADGTFAASPALAGITFATSGTDFVYVWTDDAGTTLYAKVAR